MKMSYDSLDSMDQRKRKNLGGSIMTAVKRKLTHAFKLDYQRITLEMNRYDVLRGELFIDDVIESYDECPETLSLAELIVVLFEDLLIQVKRGGLTHQYLAHMLLDGKQRHYKSNRTVESFSKKEIKKVSTYLYLFEETVEEKQEDEELNEEVIVCVTIELHESFIDRGEVLLCELKPYLGSTLITFEEMLTIRYLHFLHLIKTEGNNEKVIKVILRNLGYLED